MSTPSRIPATDTAPREAAAAGVRGWLAPEAGTLVEALGLSPASGEAERAAQLLQGLFALRPERHLRRTPGRETFAWSAAGRELVVKRLLGGEARDFWADRMALAPMRSGARREAENLRALAAAGLSVPRPLAWAEERLARWRTGRARGRSALVLERIPHRETLRERLAACGAPERRALAAELAALVRRLHGAGWCHRDLYLEHVLVEERGGTGEAGRLVLIDAGRARHCPAIPARRWLAKDLAALLHSAPAAVGRAERLRFLRAWIGPGAARAELRDWACAVEARRARLAAHAPRHVHRAEGSGPA